MVRGSWFVVRGSWFVVHGSWFVVRGSWFVVCGSWFVVHDWARGPAEKYLSRNVREIRIMKSVDLLTNPQIELDELLPLRTRLTDSLTLHANRMLAEGALPSLELLSDLQSYRQRMLGLSESLPFAISISDHETGQNESGQSEPGQEALSWNSLQHAVTQYRTKLKASDVLLQIGALRHKDDSTFAPLVACLEQAARIREIIQTRSADAEHIAALQALNDGTHPCCLLMQLVLHAEDLPDDLWTKLNDQVIEAFGRPLATAVARGKIEFVQTDVPACVVETVASQPVCDPELITATEIFEVAPATTLNIGPDNSFVDFDFAPATVVESITESVVTRDVLETSDPIDLNRIVQVEIEPPAESSLFGSEHPAEISASQTTNLETSTDDESGTFLVNLVPRQKQVDSILADHSADSIFDSIGQSSTVKAQSRNYRGPEIKLVSDQPYKWNQPDSARGASTAAPSIRFSSNHLPLLARTASQADGDVRHAQLSQVVLQLLSDDRLALAYHLTRGIETRLPGFQTNLPSWLIHSLVLSRHVCYAKGEIARKIEENLKDFSPQLLTAGDTDWNEATGFFVRAAALIPALLTSSPSAAAILRSFRITPGLSHLYNYCSRLSTYGHRLQGQASDLFTPDCDLTNWESEIATLQQSIETWLTDSIKKACPTKRSSLLFLHAHWTLTSGSVSRYAESARLWSKWQECFRLLHRLLKPVRNAQEQERNWVKGEIDRLTQCIRLEPSGSELNQPLPVGTVTFPQEAMLKMLREGIDFASRWLRLCASKPAQGRTLATRDAEALRDEILERTDSVLSELSLFSQSHTSQRTQAAVACLSGTIEHLRAIFSPHSTLALRETDPRHVVFGELLKIPNLKMNEQWAPAVDPLSLENEILSYLSGDVRDWKRAFEMQCAQRDHIATERILQLNVWRTEQEREALRRRRNSEIQACHDELERDVKDVRDLITSDAENKRLTKPFLAALEQRLLRIETGLDSTIDFAAVQNDINQVRLTFERQRREALHSEKRADATIIVMKPAAKVNPPEANDLDPHSVQDTWAQNIFSDS
jgi:hypothetical protein